MSQDIEWYKAHSRYQRLANTEPERRTIKNLGNLADAQVRQIKEYQLFINSEMKEHIQYALAEKLSYEIKKVIYKALEENKLADPDNVVELKFPASALRYQTPEQIEKLCLDWYYHQLPSKMSFSVCDGVIPDRVAYYRVSIPELIWNFTKPENL